MSEDKATTLTGADYTADDYDGDAHVPADARCGGWSRATASTWRRSTMERDLSQERIADLFENGQRPFACVITCADSRVVPEHIFMTGLGELFVIRVAGNVVGPIELGERGVCLRALAHAASAGAGAHSLRRHQGGARWGGGAGGRYHRAHRCGPRRRARPLRG